MENKLEKIQELTSRWQKTNIGSTEVMQMISDIINRKSLIGHTLQIIDIESDTLVFSTSKNRYYKIILCEKG